MAERYRPEGRALGGTVIMSRAPVRVVGIVENVTWFGLPDEVTNDMYLPLAQSPRVAGSSLTLGVRTVGDTDASFVAVREIVRAIEPELSLRYQRSMETMVAWAKGLRTILAWAMFGTVMSPTYSTRPVALSAASRVGANGFSQ